MPGFLKPTTTPTPDEIFDVWLPELSLSELRVLLYIVRRTFGFRKDADAISLSQLTKGITKKTGEVLDRGTGLSRPSVFKAVQGLEDKGLIEVSRTLADDGVNEINIYALRFREEVGTPLTRVRQDDSQGVGKDSTYGRKKSYLGVGKESTPQQTVLQQTEEQQNNLDKSKGRVESPSTSSTCQSSENITLLISDLSTQILHDPNHVEANVTQAHNIWFQSAFSEEEFIEAIQAAKTTTLAWSGSIRKHANPSTGLKNRAPYFFRVLRNMALGEEG